MRPPPWVAFAASILPTPRTPRVLLLAVFPALVLGCQNDVSATSAAHDGGVRADAPAETSTTHDAGAPVDGAKEAFSPGDGGSKLDSSADAASSVLALTVSPLALTPAFSPTIHDYYVRLRNGHP